MGVFASWPVASLYEQAHRATIDATAFACQRLRRSPLPLELLHDLLRRQVQVNLCRREPVVTKDLLERGEGNSTADGIHREGVPEDMRCDWSGDPRSVGDALEEPLNRPG